MDFLARLVFDIEAAFDDDLHLVVGVGVDERGAGFEAVESAGYGGGGREVLAVGFGCVGVSGEDGDSGRGERGEEEERRRRGGQRGGGIPGEYVAEEGVVVGDEGGLEGRLRFGVMFHSGRGGEGGGVGHFWGGCGGSFFFGKVGGGGGVGLSGEGC